MKLSRSERGLAGVTFAPRQERNVVLHRDMRTPGKPATNEPRKATQMQNNSGGRDFIVACIGFCERERRILRSVTALSTARARRYEFVDLGTRKPDLLLVDCDDTAALAAWRAVKPSAPAPAAFVTGEIRTDMGKRQLLRPLVPSRLFALLDEMTVNDLHFLPELNIGAAAGAVPEPVDVAGTSRVAGRALVVDDSPTVRKQIELGLRLVDVGVDFAESGEQALELFAGKQYDIVFLDVVLPGIDGYQVCRSMRKDRLRKNTPIVMLTGKSSTFDRVKGSLAGCSTYLTKPVENAVFQDVLKKYLGELNSKQTQGAAGFVVAHAAR